MSLKGCSLTRSPSLEATRLWYAAHAAGQSLNWSARAYLAGNSSLRPSPTFSVSVREVKSVAVGNHGFGLPLGDSDLR